MTSSTSPDTTAGQQGSASTHQPDKGHRLKKRPNSAPDLSGRNSAATNNCDTSYGDTTDACTNTHCDIVVHQFPSLADDSSSANVDESMELENYRCIGQSLANLADRLEINETPMVFRFDYDTDPFDQVAGVELGLRFPLNRNSFRHVSILLWRYCYGCLEVLVKDLLA